MTFCNSVLFLCVVQCILAQDMEVEEHPEIPTFMRRTDVSWDMAKALQESGQIPQGIDLTNPGILSQMATGGGIPFPSGLSSSDHIGSDADMKWFNTKSQDSFDTQGLNFFEGQQFDKSQNLFLEQGGQGFAQGSNAKYGDSQYDLSSLGYGGDEQLGQYSGYGGAIEEGPYNAGGYGGVAEEGQYTAGGYAGVVEEGQYTAGGYAGVVEEGQYTAGGYGAPEQDPYDSLGYSEFDTSVQMHPGPVAVYQAPSVVSLQPVRPKVYRRSKQAARRALMCSKKAYQRLARANRALYASYCGGM